MSTHIPIFSSISPNSPGSSTSSSGTSSPLLDPANVDRLVIGAVLVGAIAYGLKQAMREPTPEEKEKAQKEELQKKEAAEKARAAELLANEQREKNELLVRDLEARKSNQAGMMQDNSPILTHQHQAYRFGHVQVETQGRFSERILSSSASKVEDGIESIETLRRDKIVGDLRGARAETEEVVANGKRVLENLRDKSERIRASGNGLTLEGLSAAGEEHQLSGALAKLELSGVIAMPEGATARINRVSFQESGPVGNVTFTFPDGREANIDLFPLRERNELKEKEKASKGPQEKQLAFAE